MHVLNDAFMDGLVNAFCDHRNRTATYWGNGTETFDATTVDDTARYAARAALDVTLPTVEDLRQAITAAFRDPDVDPELFADVARNVGTYWRFLSTQATTSGRSTTFFVPEGNLVFLLGDQEIAAPPAGALARLTYAGASYSCRFVTPSLRT